IREINAPVATHRRRVCRAPFPSRGGPFHPVAAIMQQVFLRGLWSRRVVLGNHYMRFLARRPGKGLELVICRSWPPNLRQKRGDFTLIFIHRCQSNDIGIERIPFIRFGHHSNNLGPAIYIEHILQRKMVVMAAAAVVFIDQLLPSFFGGVLRKTVHPFHAGHLLRKILQHLELQYRNLLPRDCLGLGSLKSHGLSPETVLGGVSQWRESIDSALVSEHSRYIGLVLASN